MLKKSASGVLAAQRLIAPKRTPRLFPPRGLVWDKARLGALRWAGKKSGLFEHPEALLTSTPLCKIPTVYRV